MAEQLTEAERALVDFYARQYQVFIPCAAGGKPCNLLTCKDRGCVLRNTLGKHPDPDTKANMKGKG